MNLPKTSFLVLLVLFTACKSHKRTVSTSNTPVVPEKKEPLTLASNSADKAEYPLPEDSGEFVFFEINSVDEYIDTFSEIAQFEMKAYGIPASITLAQGILESGFGKSTLVKKTNNHFGIKCHTGWEGDYDFHDDDEKGECFRKYNHPMYSFRDRSLFLTSRARYAFLFDLDSNDYRGWAYGLKKAGYATDRKYPSKLISFIERYQLHTYDDKVIKQGYVLKKEPKQYELMRHKVVKGDTLYAISRKYFVSVEDIMEMNNLKNADLNVGQQLTIKTVKK